MKEEILNKLLEKSLKYLDTAEAFTAKEVPLFIKELLGFKFVEHVFDAITAPILPIIVMIILISIFKKRWEKDPETFTTFMSGAGSLISTGFLCVALLHASINLKMAYKAKYAPRVYLMDYARGVK